MNDIKIGGLVFPQTNRVNETYIDEGGYARQRVVSLDLGGISVKDYFAAAALQSLLREGGYEYEEIAKCAYKLADAMLKERERWYD